MATTPTTFILRANVIQETGLSTVKGSSVIRVNSGPAAFVYDLSAPGNQTSGVTRLEYTGGSMATLTGNNNAVTIIGGLGANSLMAGSGSSGSSLVGNFKNDTLNDNARVSTLSGGLGNDLYIVSNASSWIQESSGASGGNDTVGTTLNQFDLSATKIAGGIGVENLVYMGSGGMVTLTGNQLSNVIDARSAGNATLIGNGGSDTLLGSSLLQSLPSHRRLGSRKRLLHRGRLSDRIRCRS